MKILEMFEDEPVEAWANELLPDILYGNAENGGPGAHSIGEGVSTVFTVLDDLETRGVEFWQSILREWMINSPIVCVWLLINVHWKYNSGGTDHASRRENG